MSATQEAARLLRNEKQASRMAHEARRYIEGMHDTHANIALIFDSLEVKCSVQTAADYSGVIESLNETIARLELVYATTDEERAEATREQMGTKD